MKRYLKVIAIILAIVLVVGQFVRPKQNTSESISPNDITAQYEVPSNVALILEKACFDCHSNNTNYPSYAQIFPVSWFLYNHIYGGKKHLDFSEFKSYSAKKQKHKLEEIVEVLEEKEMPLSSYTLLHTEAKLTQEENKAIMEWAMNLNTSIVIDK